MSISEISLYNILRKNAKTGLFMTKEDKVDLIDRINKSKTETIVWIVGIGVLQFLLTLLVKLVF